MLYKKEIIEDNRKLKEINKELWMRIFSLEEDISNKNIEIKRLNNIIKEIRNQLDYLETYSSKEDVFEDMKIRLDRIDKIIGSDKE